jgi:hypothetical protein
MPVDGPVDVPVPVLLTPGVPTVGLPVPMPLLWAIALSEVPARNAAASISFRDLICMVPSVAGSLCRPFELV